MSSRRRVTHSTFYSRASFNCIRRMYGNTGSNGRYGRLRTSRILLVMVSFKQSLRQHVMHNNFSAEHHARQSSWQRIMHNLDGASRTFGQSHSSTSCNFPTERHASQQHSCSSTSCTKPLRWNITYQPTLHRQLLDKETQSTDFFTK